MPEEKTKGNKILEEALEEACKNDCERYPPYEGEIETGERYARLEGRLLRRYGADPKKRVTAASKRVSAFAASLILVCACSMAAFWTHVIFLETPPDVTQATGMTTQANGTSASVTTTTDARPSHSMVGTSANRTEVETTASATDSTLAAPEIPDEKSAVYQVVESNADGLQIEIAVHGYRSEKLKKSFYVKNNEYITVEVKLKNLSDAPVWQWLPTACRDSGTPHDHEIGAELFCGAYRLHSSHGLPCSGALRKWMVEPGETYEFCLKLAAGDICYEKDWDLPGDGEGGLPGIKLYGEDVFRDGSATFSGKIFFDYTKDEMQAANGLRVSVSLVLDVLYVSPKPNI